MNEPRGPLALLPPVIAAALQQVVTDEAALRATTILSEARLRGEDAGAAMKQALQAAVNAAASRIYHASQEKRA